MGTTNINNDQIWQYCLEMSEQIHRNFKDPRNLDFNQQIQELAIRIPKNIMDFNRCQNIFEKLKGLKQAQDNMQKLKSLVNISHKLGLVEKQKAYDLVALIQKNHLEIQSIIDLRKPKLNLQSIT